MRLGSEGRVEDQPEASGKGTVGISGFPGRPVSRLHDVYRRALDTHVRRSALTAPRPGRRSADVSSMPSRTLKMPGNSSSQGLLAAGTYSRALASIAATPGMCAAKPAEWISDAPGQVRS